MNRREVLSSVALLLGGSIIGADAFFSGCKTIGKKKELFATSDIALLDEVGETILPATASSPGAKMAKIGNFMKVIVTDCYNEKEQDIFIEGIKKLNKNSEKKYDKDFMNLAPEQKHAILLALDKEAKDHQDAINKRKLATTPKDEGKHKAEKDEPHYFAMMKQLTLWGYFTSEPGATKALRYLPDPGRYEGCTSYKKGDKAWAL